MIVQTSTTCNPRQFAVQVIVLVLDVLLYKCTLFAFTKKLFEMLKGGHKILKGCGKSLRIRAYGRSMILSFLVSNFLPYSGNLHGGRKDKEC